MNIDTLHIAVPTITVCGLRSTEDASLQGEVTVSCAIPFHVTHEIQLVMKHYHLRASLCPEPVQEPACAALVPILSCLHSATSKHIYSTPLRVTGKMMEEVTMAPALTRQPQLKQHRASVDRSLCGVESSDTQ